MKFPDNPHLLTQVAYTFYAKGEMSAALETYSKVSFELSHSLFSVCACMWTDAMWTISGLLSRFITSTPRLLVAWMSTRTVCSWRAVVPSTRTSLALYLTFPRVFTYSIAYDLLASAPEKPESWIAVGLHYFGEGKKMEALDHFRQVPFSSCFLCIFSLLTPGCLD